MNNQVQTFSLTCREAGVPAPVLTDVAASGRLDGVLFELTLRQKYLNQSDRNLEVVYTFPLPSQAVLLGFASELNGERKDGTIVAKRQAERQYEESLAQGDAPVMLEARAGGLHTANIGNLKPGDELVLEVRFAQVLVFEQDRLRLAIPMTIAPRYGSAGLAGLQPQQVPQASLEAEYPLSLSIDVSGSLAGAAVECPTHRLSREAVAGGLRLTLDRGAWIDRDVVILVKPQEPRPSLVVQSPDTRSTTAPVVVMAALQPPLAAPRDSIALKLLIDCSGSMAGDSIVSARAALQGVLEGLTEHDRVSLSRFGSTVEHLLVGTACSAHALRHADSRVKAIEADMGGTEMEQALRAVFALPRQDAGGESDVLIVTDGEIWQAAEMVAAARASGHRVFAIGVGASPAEAVLRSLAEATGGACEFATPGEALEAAARRMLTRIRQQPWHAVRIDWGAEPVWQTAVPAGVFGGDTVIAFAGLARNAATSGVRLLARGAQGQEVELARGEADAPCATDTLPRMAAARRVASADEGEALRLAVDYQLMSERTNCILVHQRADADKATGDAELHRVSSMLAAGWGATSTVMESASMDYSGLMPTSMWRSPRTFAPVVVHAVSDSDMDELEIPAFVHKQAGDQDPASLKTVALAVVEHLAHGGQVHGLPAHCAALAWHPDARLALDQVVTLRVSEGCALLLLAHWINVRTDGLGSSVAAATLQPHLDGLDASLVGKCIGEFERLLGSYAVDGWDPSRTQRLRRALSRV